MYFSAMRFTERILLLLFLILCANGTANASPNSNDSIYPFLSYKHYGEEEGLLCKTVYSCIQDNDGFMWFGTDNGVFRYDGRKFKHFTKEDGITDNEVFMLYQDRYSRIWFLTFNGYLSFWKNGKIYNPDNTPFLKEAYTGGSIRSYYEDKSGSLWFATERSGFITIKNESVQKIKETSSNSLNYNLKNYNLRFIHEDLNGNIWTFIRNKMYKIFEKNTKDSITLPTTLNYNYLCHEKNNFTTYFCTSLGVHKISDLTISIYIKKSELPSINKISNIFSIQDTFWVCTNGNGCYQYSKGKLIGKYLDEYSITCILKDREENLWFCTREKGIYMLPANFRLLKHFTQSTGLSDNKITDVIFDKNNKLWIGYSSGILDEISGNLRCSFKFNKLSGPNYCRITSLIIDSNITWCGTDVGIYYIKKGNKTFVYRKDVASGLSIEPYSVKQLFQDSHKNIYATCYNNILQFSNNRQYPYFSSLLDSIVRTFSIIEYKKNRFLFSGLEGLLEYLPDKNKCYNYPTSINFSYVRAIDMKLDADSLLIVATDGAGLYILKDQRVLQHISLTTGLSDNNCKRIYIYDGHMYIATNNGLNILLKKNNQWTVVETITTKNGLLSNAISSIALSNENIYIGTDGGLAVISRIESVHDSYIGKVNVTEITTDSTLTVSNDHYSFSAAIPRLIIRFAYPVYNPANVTKIKYRLMRDDKKESEWFNAENNEVEFSSLSPGKYIFQLIPENETNINKRVSNLYLTITPLWWQTNIFRIIIALIVFGIAVMASRMVTKRRYEKQMIELKQRNVLELERNRIASDMHDDLGADLTYIAILGEMVKQNTKLESEAVNNLNKLTDASKKVIDKMGEIIWAINSSNDSLANLMSYLHKYSKDFLESKGIDCFVTMPLHIPDIKLTASFRRNVFLIFKEATNNIVKHSGTKKAELAFSAEANELIIFIKDFGNPVPNDSSERNGLKNMQKRTEENRGKLKIIFTKGIGTLVEYRSKI
jgi:signal transduction histidine kinase